MCAQLFKTSQRTRPKSAIRFVFASWQLDHEPLGALPSAKQIPSPTCEPSLQI